MRKIVTEINPILPRANAKYVRAGKRHFLIGIAIGAIQVA